MSADRTAADQFDPRALLSINSIALIPAEFGGHARAEGDERARIDRKLNEVASRELDVEVVGTDRTAADWAPNHSPTKLIADACSFGKRVGADGVLITTVSTLNEREGSRVGLTEPAALGFEMALYRTTDGVRVWGAQYTGRDEAISDNLFNIPKTLKGRQPSGWRTSQDFLNEGFEEAIRDLQHRRLRAFSGQG